MAFALRLRKKHGQTSARVTKTSVRLRKTSVTVQYTYYQKHPHITKPSQTHTLENSLIHTQKNIKPPQYKLKRHAHVSVITNYLCFLTLSLPAGHTCIFPTYKESFQVRCGKSIPPFLHAAIYLEVYLFR
jgi:hypothetical protein